MISILDDDLRIAISSAYGAVSLANESTRAWVNRYDHDGQDYTGGNGKTLKEVQQAIPLIEQARDRLLHFVQSEPDESH